MATLATTITLAVGETLQMVCTMTSDGVPTDLTGMTPVMTVRDGQGTLCATLGSGQITFGVGTITFGWPCTLGEGSYNYDLWADRRRLLSGILSVESTPTVWS